MELGSSLKIGNCEAHTRLVLPPMATEKAPDHRVTDELCAYYTRMAADGAFGVIYTEHTFISPEGQASPNQLSLADEESVAGHARLAEAIHRGGSLAMAQLNHAGSGARSGITGLPAFGPSAVKNPRANFKKAMEPEPQELTQQDIDRLIDCYAAAARRAVSAGYDGVEIHCAHGYLLDQFYSPLTNRRTDEYTGADLVGRTRLQRQVIRAVRETIGSAPVISLRLGATDLAPGGADVSEVPAAAALLATESLDMLSISGGMCGYQADGLTAEGYFSDLSAAAKGAVTIPVLLTGGIRTSAAASRLIEEGAADLIGVGRPLLIDPHYAARMLAGEI